MKHVILLSFFIICLHHAEAQSSDTATVNMLDFSSQATDASQLEFNKNIQRYFNRNLRTPMQGRELQLGYASVSFIVDKEGKVTNPLCPSMTNSAVGKEALSVAKKLTRTHVVPLMKNGQPVVAKVNINICFTTNDQLSAAEKEIRSKAAILVVANAN